MPVIPVGQIHAAVEPGDRQKDHQQKPQDPQLAEKPLCLFPFKRFACGEKAGKIRDRIRTPGEQPSRPPVPEHRQKRSQRQQQIFLPAAADKSVPGADQEHGRQKPQRRVQNI